MAPYGFATWRYANKTVNPEAVMKAKGRAIAAVILAAFILGVAAQGVASAGTIRQIQGVVEFVSQNTLTIKGTVHDIRGATVVDENDKRIVHIGSDLVGKRAIIVTDDGKVISVKIFPEILR